MNKKTSYFFEIVILPIIIIVFLVISITTYNIQITKKRIQDSIDLREKELTTNLKQDVYNRVQNVNSLIKIEHEKIEPQIKKVLLEKIESAIKISNDIYEDNKGLSKNLIRKILAKRLSFLEYNNSRGYFFIIDEKGVFLDHPIKKFVGKDMSNFKDVNGNYIDKLLRKSAKNKKIGFVKYSFYNPNKKSKKQYSKITAVTYVKSLDILIGTGEYYDAIVEEKKKDMIKRLSVNLTDENQYIFITQLHNINGGKEFSTMLLNSNRKDLENTILSDEVPDSKGFFYRKEYLKLLREKGEGFLTYWYKKPNTNLEKPKTTYFYLNKQWNWIIGSGFYLDNVENKISTYKKSSNLHLEELIKNSVFWGVIFTAAMIFLSSFLFYRIQKRINKDKEDLILSRENLKKAQEVAKIGSWDYDLKLNNITWSEEIYSILELNKSIKPSYKLFLSLVYKEDKQLVNKAFNEAIEKRVSKNFIHRVKVNGKIKWLETHYNTFFNSDKKSYFLIGTVQDITEKQKKDKKLEEQSQLLFHQSKMAAMGEMLENIAHQWRQPLSAVSTSASGLRVENEYDMLNSQKLDKGLGDILENVNYLSNTIDDFRGFFLKDKKIVKCDLKNTHKKCMHLLNSKFVNRSIKLVEDVKSVECFTLENELIQCLMNILNNAYDQLKDKNLDERLIFINIYEKYENAVIKISDNGGGIDEKLINKIFEPYFTTKHQSQGTGIGLYMTQEIITKHLNGLIKASNKDIKYNNAAYKGAVFKITIPLRKEIG